MMSRQLQLQLQLQQQQLQQQQLQQQQLQQQQLQQVVVPPPAAAAAVAAAVAAGGAGASVAAAMAMRQVDGLGGLMGMQRHVMRPLKRPEPWPTLPPGLVPPGMQVSRAANGPLTAFIPGGPLCMHDASLHA